MHWAMKRKEHLIYLCHFSISHLFWLVRCIDYPNVMIGISFIDAATVAVAYFSCFSWYTIKVLGLRCISCTEREGKLIEIPCTGYAISMVDASIRLELISIFTFNYCIEWKIKTVRNHTSPAACDGMAVLLPFPNVTQCMLVDRVTSAKKNNRHQQEKLIRSLVRCQPFFSFQQQWHWEKFHRNFSHTHRRAEEWNHFQLNAVFYDEHRFLRQFHLSCYSNRRHLYQWTVYNALVALLLSLWNGEEETERHQKGDKC